jgi:hydrogenase maturation factor
MCLGIPGQITETNVTHEHLARVEVNGVGRIINVALLEEEHLMPGAHHALHVQLSVTEMKTVACPHGPACEQIE